MFFLIKLGIKKKFHVGYSTVVIYSNKFQWYCMFIYYRKLCQRPFIQTMVVEPINVVENKNFQALYKPEIFFFLFYSNMTYSGLYFVWWSVKNSKQSFWNYYGEAAIPNKT